MEWISRTDAAEAIRKLNEEDLRFVNRLREAYDFEGTPIRLQLRVNRTKPGDLNVDADL